MCLRAPARVCVSYRGAIGYLLKCQRSCVTQFVHDIISNLDGAVNRRHKQTDFIIMDFAKAFDKVPHSSNGQWHAHIENIRCYKKYQASCESSNLLSAKMHNQIYLLHLLPILEYASLVWDGCTQQDSNTLQKIQNGTARIFTGLTRSVSLEKIYNECG